MPKPPRDVSYFDKVNYVIDAWAMPCEAPWYIYVETLKPALLEAFITLATFGWDDVARGYFRPRGLGGRRTGKRKGKFAKAIPRFPELGEEIGKRLPGAEEVKGEKWSALGKTLWRIDTVIQRALFWWLVADVTIDFAYNWTSLLYETVWCQASNLGRFSYQSGDDRNAPGGIWWVAAYEDLDYQHGGLAWNINRGFAGPTGCVATATMTFTQIAPFPDPTETGVRIFERDTGKVLHQTGPMPFGADPELKMVVSGELAPGTRFGVQTFHEPDWCRVGDGIVMALALS